jgi:hypothetical protein
MMQEERALVADLQDKIIELLVGRQEAKARCDDALAEEMQVKIDRLRTECDQIRQAAAV